MDHFTVLAHTRVQLRTLIRSGLLCLGSATIRARQIASSLFLMLATGLVSLGLLASVGQSSTGKLIPLSIRFDGVTMAATTIKINAFTNGGEVANLYTSSVEAGATALQLSYKLTDLRYKGIGEIVIDNVGSFPVIIGESIPELTVTNDQLKSYTPPAATSELMLLGNFMKIYRGYETMLAHYQQQLISPYGTYSSDAGVYVRFLADYRSFRNQFNLFFQYANQAAPNTYTSTTFSKLFTVSKLPESWQDVRDTYFNNWDFTNKNTLNNPLFDRQFDIYGLLANIPSVQNEQASIDALYKNLTAEKRTDPLLLEHLRTKSVIQLFRENKTGAKDKAIEYLYQRWLSQQDDNCAEEATGDALFQKAFFKRLGNIGNMKEGAVLPAVSGFTSAGAALSTTDWLGTKAKTPYVLLFLWSSTCSHCEEYAPQLQAFVQQHPGQVQVIAYSIDKANTEANWKQITAGRASLNNWIDIAEPTDMESKGISKICYMGTPSVFLLNQSGVILSKSTDLTELSNLIN